MMKMIPLFVAIIPTTDDYEMYSACGGIMPVSAYVKTATKDSDSIVVNVKYYLDENASTNTTEDRTIGNLDAKNNFKNIKINKSLQQSDIINNYDKYIDTYKFTFKKASDNNYYFYSVENKSDGVVYEVSKNNVVTNVKTETKKVSNPNTADKNIALLITTGIIMFAVILYSGKKLFVRR